jgi:hypothetical protein
LLGKLTPATSDEFEQCMKKAAAESTKDFAAEVCHS